MLEKFLTLYALNKSRNSGGGASSWNELTDKPFGDTVTGCFIPETTATPNSDGNIILLDFINLVEGETYTVKWNGVEYLCTAKVGTAEGLTFTSLGNQILNDGEDTGEPFGILLLPIGNPMIYGGVISVLDGSESVTYSIYGPTAKKLDPVYLPGSLTLYAWPTRDYYIYSSSDCSIESRVTMAQLKDIIDSGRTVYITARNTGESTKLAYVLPSRYLLYLEGGYGTIEVYMPGEEMELTTLYTAEHSE